MTKISLDQIMGERLTSVHKSKNGDALFKITKAPASWDSEARSARYFMSVEIEDRYGDIVVAKGGDFADFVNNPVALWGHNSRNFPIGMWSDVKAVSGKPRRVEGTVHLADEGTTEEADTAAKLVAQNMLRACSIGFMPREWEAIDKENPWGGYRFLEWELWECSLCSIPANPQALVKAAGGDTRLMLQSIELVLDEWARTPDGLIVPRSDYEKAYQIAKKANVTLHEVRSIEDSSAEPVVVDVDIKSIEDNVFARILKAITGGASKEVVLALPPAESDAEAEQKLAAEAETKRLADETEQKRIADEAAARKRIEDEDAELELRARVAALVD